MLHTFAENLRVGEKERRVPAQEYEPRHAPRIGMPRDIVVSLHPVDAPQHRRIRPPRAPQKHQHGERQRDPHACHDAGQHDAEETDDCLHELAAPQAI